MYGGKGRGGGRGGEGRESYDSYFLLLESRRGEDFEVERKLFGPSLVCLLSPKFRGLVTGGSSIMSWGL